mgnify:CR=1 FL=1
MNEVYRTSSINDDKENTGCSDRSTMFSKINMQRALKPNISNTNKEYGNNFSL